MRLSELVKLPEKKKYWHSKLGYPENCYEAYNQALSEISLLLDKEVGVDVSAVRAILVSNTSENWKSDYDSASKAIASKLPEILTCKEGHKND